MKALAYTTLMPVTVAWLILMALKERPTRLTYAFGAVITDAPGRRDVVHMTLPTANALIRFVGNNLDQTDYKRADFWIDPLKAWKDAGLQTIWFFVHQHDVTCAPTLADYFILQLNEKLGIEVKRPDLVCR